MDKYISIIIPALNAGKYLEECLRAVRKLRYPKDKVELILVDNGSTDNTVEIAKTYGVKVFVEKKCTISVLRNLGASKAKGEVLAFLDADCVPEESWAYEAVNALKNECVGAVGCWYKLPAKTALVERVWDAHMSGRREKRGEINWVPGGNFVVSREVFQRVAGFDEFLVTSEDTDICCRIRRLGLKVVTYPEVAVVHLGNAKTLKQHFLKEIWRGTGVIQDFVFKFPNSEFNKAAGFSLSMMVLSLGMIAGISAWSIGKGNYIFLVFLFGFLVFPLGTSCKSAVNQKKWVYFLPLVGLLVVFCFSRGLSVFNFKALFFDKKTVSNKWVSVNVKENSQGGDVLSSVSDKSFLVEERSRNDK